MGLKEKDILGKSNSKYKGLEMWKTCSKGSVNGL